MIVAGGGVHYAAALGELREFAEACRIPVAETSAGKGALGGSDLSVGGIGVTGTRVANALARQADLVVSVGTRLIDLTTGSHTLFEDPDARFVGINVAAPDAYKVHALPIVSDARLALAALGDALAGLELAACLAARG